MNPLKIYMGDITHDQIVLVSDTIPINIGFIGAYAKKLFGDDIEVSLFKYPKTILDAIRQSPPDVLALSNYSWNGYLSERLSQFAKENNPDMITVQGGTNFPHQARQQRDFLARRPHTDIYVELEGEVAFSNLISRVLAARNGAEELYDRPVDGCVFIQPSTRLSNEKLLIKGDLPVRIRDLDVIPSPYLNGMLEHFFDGRLTPFLETNRGCPFKCAFCHTGNDYFQKTNMFSKKRLLAEIEYIAPRVASRGIVNLHIADTNFGMYPRDRDICIALREAHDKYGWPLQIMSTTGKNNKERVIDITSIMGDIFSVNMSVQSMDQGVLSNIKRSNISLDSYMEINEKLNQQGRATNGELILGMPGETRESFLRGLEQMIESGVSTVCIYTLMLLHGTEFQDADYRSKFGIKGRFRIVPLNFGVYEGTRVLDYEEVGVQTNDLSFDDYLYLRGLSLMVETLHNGRPFDELFRYAMSLGVRRAQMLFRIHDGLDQAPEEIQSVMRGFLEETRSELWESEGEMVAYYQEDENFQRLARGDVGGNLIYKYKAVSLAHTADTWVGFLSESCKEIAQERLTSGAALDEAKQQIDCLADFCSKKLSGLLNAHTPTAPLYMDSPYDIVGWLKSEDDAKLDEFTTANPIHYEFAYSDDQIKVRSDQFNRYGSGIDALSKIVTRVSNIESLFRKVRTPEAEQALYEDITRDRFTRYTLSS